jgi:CRP-like cAMP-binding protein
VSAVAEELGRVAVFSDLPAPALTQLASRAHTRRLSRGQVLFSQGEPTEHLFVVRSGSLRVILNSARGDDLILTVLKPGDTIGELSVLDGQTRSAGVEAQEASELLAVPAADVRAALLAHPAAMLAVVEELAANVRRLTDHAADLVFLDVPRRLAKLLVTEAVQWPDGSTVCELNMSQAQVASRLGATRQSLNRALGEFGRRGWVTVDGTTIRLDDAAALRRFTDS